MAQPLAGPVERECNFIPVGGRRIRRPWDARLSAPRPAQLGYTAGSNRCGSPGGTNRVGNLTPVSHLMQSQCEQGLPVRPEMLLYALRLPGGRLIQVGIAERIEELQIHLPEM